MVTCSWVIATILSSWRYMCNSEVFKCVCECIGVFKISTQQCFKSVYCLNVELMFRSPTKLASLLDKPGI